LNSLDAEALAVGTGDLIEIGHLSGAAILIAPVRIEKTLPRGLLGIMAGRPEFQAMKAGSLVTLNKLSLEQRDNSEDYL